MALSFLVGVVVSHVITKHLIGKQKKTDDQKISEDANQEVHIVHSNQREPPNEDSSTHFYCEIDDESKNTNIQATVIAEKPIPMFSNDSYEQPRIRSSKMVEMKLKASTANNKVISLKVPISVNPNESHGQPEVVRLSEVNVKPTTNVSYDQVKSILVIDNPSNDLHAQPLSYPFKTIVESSEVTLKTNVSYTQAEKVKKRCPAIASNFLD